MNKHNRSEDFCAYYPVLSFFSILVDVGARLFAGCADYFFGVVIDEVARAVVGTVMFVGFNRLVVVVNLVESGSSQIW